MSDGIILELKDKEFFDELKVAISGASPILKFLAEDAVQYSQANFERQSTFGIKWKPRAVPNLHGIINDINEGRKPPIRRIDPRPALIDTGMLRRSITYELSSTTSVRIGTNKPYAKVHQLGGIVVSKKKASNFDEQYIKWLNTVKSRLSKTQLARAGRILSLSQISSMMPARPFLSYPEKEGKEIIEEYLSNKFGGGSGINR